MASNVEPVLVVVVAQQLVKATELERLGEPIGGLELESIPGVIDRDVENRVLLEVGDEP